MVALGLALTFQNGYEPRGISESYRAVVDDVVEAEELGFSAALVTEHHFDPSDWCPSPIVAAAGLATVTSKMTVGTAISILPMRNVIRVAEDLAVLEAMSNGRALLGVGAGYRESEFAGSSVKFSERLAVFEEQLQILDQAVGDAVVSYDGPFHPNVDCELHPRIGRSIGEILWIGANSRAGMRRAAIRGVPLYIGNGAPLNLLERRLLMYDQYLREAGFDTAKVARPLMRDVYVAADKRSLGDGQKAVMRKYQEELLRLGFGVLLEDGSVAETSNHPVFASFEKLAHDRVIVGTPDECVVQLQECIDRLHPTIVICHLHHAGLSPGRVRESMRLLATEVMPRL